MLHPELQGAVTPCYPQQLPSQGVGDTGFSSLCPLIIDEVLSGLQKKRKKMSSSSPFSSFYPKLSTTALSAAGNSGLVDPHDTTPGAVEQGAQATGEPASAARPLPQTTPPGPASPGNC